MEEYERDFPHLAGRLAAAFATPTQPYAPGVGPRSQEQSSDAAGRIIAALPNKLLDVLGEGGMGTVWLAEQTNPVTRTVALKFDPGRRRQ